MDRALESGVDEPQPSTGSSIGVRAGHRRSIQKKIAWLVCILAVGFCAWRMALFIPQPLDAPGSLRPVLYRLFTRFIRLYDSPEQAFSAWYTFCSIALLIPAALAALNYAVRRSEYPLRERVAAWLGSRTLLFASIAVCLFICRFPALLEPELNPDEGQFLASADKLFYDADFFRAADCGTSGPLNIYPLMLPSVFGISPDFASSRVIALGALFLCIYLLYRTVLLIAPDDIARIAILPAAGMFAVFKNVGFVEYSSEDIPVLLVSLALYTAVRVLRRPANYRVPIFVIGVLSSAAFFAKLQAVPIMAVLAGIAIAYVYVTGGARTGWWSALLFAAGAATLQIINAALCLTTGVWRNFWMSYIVTNLHYADVETRFVTGLSPFLSYLGAFDEVRLLLFTLLGLAAAYAFQRLRRKPATASIAFLETAGVSAVAISLAVFLYVSNVPAVAAYLALIAIAVVPMYLLLRWRERPPGKDPAQWFGLLIVLFLAASVFSVYEAHRPFPHYLLFLFIPISMTIAWMLMRETNIAFVAVTVVLTLVCQAYLWGTEDDHVFKNVTATIRAPEGDFIRSMTTPEGRIEVWGWTVVPYLASGRVPATRDTNMANFFRWPEITKYYRGRFLRDLKSDPPEMFIDAVGPASFGMVDPRLFNFAQFHEIEAFISTYYVHSADLYGERYFLRRDLAARSHAAH